MKWTIRFPEKNNNSGFQLFYTHNVQLFFFFFYSDPNWSMCLMETAGSHHRRWLRIATTVVCAWPEMIQFPTGVLKWGLRWASHHIISLLLTAEWRGTTQWSRFQPVVTAGCSENRLQWGNHKENAGFHGSVGFPLRTTASGSLSQGRDERRSDEARDGDGGFLISTRPRDPLVLGFGLHSATCVITPGSSISSAC